MRLPARDSTQRWLETEPAVEVLVVGGGINGAAVLRDLALNHVSALLVDRADFCSGATSASSRMIHGGLRYLENGEFRLVRESLRERNRLLRLAPHAVRPLPTTIPILHCWSGIGAALGRFLGRPRPPTGRGAVLVKIGLSLYDLLTARDRVLPRHHFTGRKAALRLRPRLNPRIVCTATYHDAQVALPERLCLELIADGCSAYSGARALNYCAVAGSGNATVELRDQVSGATYAVRPRVVVNATGAWIDPTNAVLAQPTQWIGGTKGSHLVLDHPELLAACRGEQLFYEAPDGRICIFFPVNGRVLVGSTDIRITDPDAAVCTEAEVDYMLENVRTVFPTLHVGREHIISRFCGVRPLPAAESERTGQISRDHSLRSLPAAPGRPWAVHAMVGGKWTTHRAFAEQVVDRILAELGRRRTQSTAGRAIPADPIENLPDDATLAGIVRDEAVVHLDDLLLRRTAIGLYDRLTEGRLHRLAGIAAENLGWDRSRLDAELTRTRELLATQHGVAITATPDFSHVDSPKTST